MTGLDIKTAQSKNKPRLLSIVYGLKGTNIKLLNLLEEYKFKIKSLQFRLDLANKKVKYLEDSSPHKITYGRISKDTVTRSIGALRRNQNNRKNQRRDHK